MQFTLSQAAKEAGISKSTLSKALKDGRVSGERLPDGSFRIEASELFRAFARKPVETQSGTVYEQARTPSELLDAELALMRLRVQMLEDQLSRERELRDQERETSQDTVADLRRRLDRAEERGLALEAKPVEAPAPITGLMDAPGSGEPADPSTPLLPGRPTGLLARLLGRG